MTVSSQLKEALQQFDIPGELIELAPLGQGNINDTYLGTWNLTQGGTRHYVHQRLNTRVFREPQIVMTNMRLVTEHIGKKHMGEEYKQWQRAHAFNQPPLCSIHGREELRVLHLIPTRSGADFLRDNEDSVWRSTNFLDGLDTFETLQNEEHAFQVGRCLGEFHHLVSDLDTTQLGDSLPGFHHTEKYFAKFRAALDSEPAKKAIQSDSQVAHLVKEILARESCAFRFANGISTGALRMRTVHNDPKISNFMFCPKTNAAVCLIDLDTVKPGLVHYDFGDCVRSAANRAGEETKDLAAVKADLDVFSAIARGYCGEARAFLDTGERDLLVESTKIIAFELAMRFFTSHLLNDGYFKERYKGNNLHRTRVQLELVKDLERKESEMRKIIEAALRDRAA